jgi:hypothetical protein
VTLADAAFAKEGFAIIAEALTSTQVDSLSEELLRLPMPQGKAGLRHLLSNPTVSAMAHHSRILGLAKSLLGLHIEYSAVPVFADGMQLAIA